MFVIGAGGPEAGRSIGTCLRGSMGAVHEADDGRGPLQKRAFERSTGG